MNEVLMREAKKLRAQGKTYSEICACLGERIPKGTLSYWCRHVSLNKDALSALRKTQHNHLMLARRNAATTQKHLREQKEECLREKLRPVAERMHEQEIAKIALAMLYLGEGFKSKKAQSASETQTPA